MSNILIAGTGPVAVQLAYIFTTEQQNQVDMVGRAKCSQKSKKFYQAYHQYQQQLEVTVQNNQHQALSGRFHIHHLYADYSDVTHTATMNHYDTLVLACNADAYTSVIQQMPQTVLENLHHIILISPTIGSHMIVQQQLAEINADVEVISFSTYIGDTRVIDETTPHQVMTTGVKKHVYIGSTSNKKESDFMLEMQRLFEGVNVRLIALDTPLFAESRNSSLYVHPPLFMNDFSLDVILNGSDVPVYVYKLFPEGPITMNLIHEMRLLWQEITLILERLNVLSLNLLEFMVKENYPVRKETFSEQEIKYFQKLPPIHQEYLLYVRYSAILIDPFSKPDIDGKYFDFSAVPFKQIYQNEQGMMQIPRMPYEDYYRTTIIQQIGALVGIETPMINRFLQRYALHISKFVEGHTELEYSEQFQQQHFEADVDLIKNYLKNVSH
ncbi:opine metallophore biosynthesis dehydrogenase [Staphylococcus caeli]|uniref:opine metallophore biosynthesis dehydrogenase n=1 Tax=Staphylococcus caeli TaxID=2201815 RepID=UPI003F558CCE